MVQTYARSKRRNGAMEAPPERGRDQGVQRCPKGAGQLRDGGEGGEAVRRVRGRRCGGQACGQANAGQHGGLDGQTALTTHTAFQGRGPSLRWLCDGSALEGRSERLHATTTRLTQVMIGLTAILVLLTAKLSVLTAVLAFE